MVELVGERGYAAVTVRDIDRAAGVSSRTLYELFGGIEECFLDTYDHVVRGVVKRITAAQAGESDRLEGLRLAFRTFASELELKPPELTSCSDRGLIGGTCCT
jgi:AcrR family transcriptional regulator